MFLELMYLESDGFHAKDSGVEVDGVWDTFHCQNQMVQVAQLYRAAGFQSDRSWCLDGDNLRKER